MLDTEFHFDDIYSRYYSKIKSFVYSYIHDEAISEDIASETIITVWERFRESEEIRNISSLIFTIAKNKALDTLRHMKTQLKYRDHATNLAYREFNFQIQTLEASDPKVVFSQEIMSIIDKTLNELPIQTKTIFIKSRFNMVSTKELADEYGITVKGVEYHIAKTIAKLRISLSDYISIAAISFFLHK